jgi:hypothetical protein
VRACNFSRRRDNVRGGESILVARASSGFGHKG